MADQVDSMSDAELRKKLVEHGFPVMPITDSTRKLLVKKLKLVLDSKTKPLTGADNRAKPRTLARYSSGDASAQNLGATYKSHANRDDRFATYNSHENRDDRFVPYNSHENRDGRFATYNSHENRDDRFVTYNSHENRDGRGVTNNSHENRDGEIYSMVEQIIDFISQETEESGETYISVDHVRDTLISPQNREKMASIWDAAVKFIQRNESRVRMEVQSVDGEDCRVWRWCSSQNNPKRSTAWQGQAFAAQEGSVNNFPVSPTPCLKIRHMFDKNDTNQNLRTVVADAILEKCGECCNVLHVDVDRASCCVYVKCASDSDAGVVYRSLHGWWYDGRLITVKYLRLERYMQRFPNSPTVGPYLKISPDQNRGGRGATYNSQEKRNVRRVTISEAAPKKYSYSSVKQDADDSSKKVKDNMETATTHGVTFMDVDDYEPSDNGVGADRKTSLLCHPSSLSPPSYMSSLSPDRLDAIRARLGLTSNLANCPSTSNYTSNYTTTTYQPSTPTVDEVESPYLSNFTRLQSALKAEPAKPAYVDIDIYNGTNPLLSSQPYISGPPDGLASGNYTKTSYQPSTTVNEDESPYLSNFTKRLIALKAETAKPTDVDNVDKDINSRSNPLLPRRPIRPNYIAGVAYPAHLASNNYTSSYTATTYQPSTSTTTTSQPTTSSIDEVKSNKNKPFNITININIQQ